MRIYGSPLLRTAVPKHRTFTFLRSLAASLMLAAGSSSAWAEAAVTLDWGGSSAPDVIGYHLYEGGTSHSYTNVTDVGNVTTAVVINLTAGGKYFFAVSAYNSVGLESPLSNERSYQVPSSTPASPGPTNSPGSGPGRLLWAAGSYHGLFYESNQVQQGSSGAFVMTSTKAGLYSGYLQLGGTRLSFHGVFDAQGGASNSLPRRGASPLTLQFHPAGGASADQAQGTVSADYWQADLAADRQVFNAHSNPAPLQGLYTLLIPGQEQNDSTLPSGHSFGRVRINAGGQVQLAGSLADGTKFSQSAPLSAQGLWALYAPLYAGQGSVLSWIAFTNRPADDFNGALSWLKPANSHARYYPSGFTNSCQALGSTYVAPSTGVPALSFPTGALRFVGGDLTTGITNLVAQSSSGRFSNLSRHRLSLSLSTATGVFGGRVTEPASGRSLAFFGAVFQKLQAGYGFLLGAEQSSQVGLNR